MVYLTILLFLINLYLTVNLLVSKKINSIFRHDLFNDLQLVDGFLKLNQGEISKEYLNKAYEKKDLYSKLEHTNLLIKLAFLLLYSNLQKKTSNFQIYLDPNIPCNIIFSIKFVKTIYKVYNYIRTVEDNNFTVEIDRDCVEVLSENTGVSFKL